MKLSDLKVSFFPDGHKHIDCQGMYDASRTIEASLRSFDDLFLLAQVREQIPAVDNLRILYLLAGRYDEKFKGEKDSLDLRIVANFINRLEYKTVTILRPHSKVALSLIENSKEEDVTETLLTKCLMDIYQGSSQSNICVLSPDVGASKWASKIPLLKERRWPLIQCHKERNLLTNKIEDVKILGKPSETCIIIDDLCDGGATYIEMANAAKALGAKRVYLVVTHGIFSKGFDVFEGLVNHIYCTNSFKDHEHKLVTQVKL